MVRLDLEDRVVAGHLGLAADYHPMLDTVPVALEREAGARVDDHALDLETFAGVDAFVRAPGPVDTGVQFALFACGRVKPVDDRADVLGTAAGADQDGVLVCSSRPPLPAKERNCFG